MTKIAIALAALMLTGAWDTPPPAPQSSAAATAKASALASASVRVHQAQQQAATSVSQGGAASVSYSGGSAGGGVYLSIPDGHGEAPCGGGIGLGGGGSNAGGGVGGTLWEFSDCKRMRESAALDRMGFRDAAVAELCQIDRVREAFGGKCPGKPAHLVSDVDVGKPDYCFTRNVGDINQHRECDREVRR